MADVDTRLARQSATCMLVPSMLSGVFPDTAGVVKLERQSVSWSYGGINAGEVEAIAWLNVVFRGVDAITGEYVYLIGQYRDV